MSAVQLAPYAVEAFNTAKESENRIHDDSIAKRFGFTGGLVPGVDVYAYMMHQPVARWGRAWLERGTASCRFGKPVYDGRIATVSASESAEGLAIEVHSDDGLSATGSAGLPASAPAAPSLDGLVAAASPATRPPASAESLATGRWLGMRPLAVTPDYAAAYLRDLRETDPIYASEALVHPGLILRMGNWVLGQNVVLGPWIHVGSTVQNFAAGHVGDSIEGRALVTNNYMHKGHAFVDLDVVVLANGTTPLARIAHTAIWQPRQVANA
jgi:hypothetical protein